MQTDFKLYRVDMKYIRNLHNIDDKVLSVSPQAGKDNRIFVGIVVICGIHKYCIPLSSPKKKHTKMKNSMDFSKIEINGKLLGVLNFNLMIPIEEEQLQLVDTTIFKRDRENIKYYKRLCVQELEWCRNNSEVICNKANVLYKKYISNEPFTGRNRCLNFPKLELECKKYNSKILESLKKIISISLITLMLLGLFGCSQKEPSVVKTYEVTDPELVEEYWDNNELVTMVKYYEMSDGTWKTDTYIYQYRLEITGRNNAAVKDSTFVFLSNIEDITFEQAWKASGFSSNIADYFKEEDARFVALK